MTAPYELGRTAYETFIRGDEANRCTWPQLSGWVQARWARVELESRKAEVRSNERLRALAESGRTSPTQLWGKR